MEGPPTIHPTHAVPRYEPYRPKDVSMESAEERRARIQKKAKRQFVMLVAAIIGLSAYIAYFTGDRFLAMQDERPHD